jgi:hypothetical protein
LPSITVRTAIFPVAIVCAVTFCGSPSDVIYVPGPSPPVEGANGLFRVTFGTGPAVESGFTSDGRLLIRTRDVAPFGMGWLILSVSPEEGRSREEAALYRQALVDEMGSLRTLGQRRVLATWKQPVQGTDGCLPPAPVVAPLVGVTFFDLPADDATVVDRLPSRFANYGIVTGAASLQQRARVTPALQEIRANDGNPFGPALVPGGNDVIYSDGERIWRASMEDVSQPADLIGVGAYPAVSDDGTLLAYARPADVDSTVTLYVVPSLLAVCYQEQVEITAGRWEIVVRDLASGTERVLGDGLEPVFDPMAPRVVVRGADLSWVELADGVRTSIVGTGGAFAPAISPDGTLLAFSLPGDANSDVYYLPIRR